MIDHLDFGGHVHLILLINCSNFTARVAKGVPTEFVPILDFAKHGSIGGSRLMGVTEKRAEKSGIGGRARTMAGAGPTDILYGSRGLPAA